MKIEDVKKMLVESEGNTTLSIKIPSTGETYQFKPITVGARKTLAKYSLNKYSSDTQLNFQVSKLALIKTLCLDDKFDETELTEIDFIYILANLRQFNILDDLVISTTCPKCGSEITHSLNLNTIITRCEEYKHNVVSKERVDKRGIKWKFILTDPMVYNTIIIEKYILENDKSEEDRFLLRPYSFIHALYCNDELIEDFTKLNVMEKIAFLSDLDDRVMYDNNGIIETINNEFKRDIKLYDGIRCNDSKCDYIMEGVVTSDNFFIS